MNDRQSHWGKIYKTKHPEAVSWYQPSLQISLELIQRTGLPHDAAIIDVGSGASTLVDDLLSLEYTNITLLDLSTQALELCKARLGNRANLVKWKTGDVTTAALSGFDLWHDRAVFHFFVTVAERQEYCAALEAAVRPGGFAIIATFGPHGPMKCSGLQIQRYSQDSLQQTLGTAFSLVTSQIEQHRTPSNVTQEFVYCLFKRAN